MVQRGRKSAEAQSLASVTSIVTEKPAPPDDFNEFQSTLWRKVVDSRRADYFGPDSLEMLRAYVMHAYYCRRIDAQLQRLEFFADADPATVVDTYTTLLKQREAETNAMIKAARSLRITHQSLDPKVAANRQRNPASPVLPWQAK